MFENLLFVSGLAGFLFLLAGWGFKFLPNEKWQVLGTIPIVKTTDGKWKGLNLTYYGVFNGVAIMVAVAIMMVMLGSIQTPFWLVAMFIVGTLAFAGPSAKIVARVVERKPATLTVGGASFVGVITAPWIALGAREIGLLTNGVSINILALLASISTAYAFGEGIGRLSCISFGCCYGKPVESLPKSIQMIFHRIHFVFHGKTKKIAYAHCLDEKAILPIQGITSAIYMIVGLVGLYLFLTRHFAATFILTLAVTQIWRVISEFLRADYRGSGKLSVYQIMAFISVLYAIPISFLFQDVSTTEIVIYNGIKSLWSPPVILFLQGLWLLVFISTGRSKVITAELTFGVQVENI